MKMVIVTATSAMIALEALKKSVGK